ncbi:hypothetical protein EGR_05421 [Echinococcus granulosus]|uniref:Uncharacterized protein n=1 Tax=Echinococcus granulosus TaxID=6210 RepID=W6V1C9_ECHGR|nr:hypothetical protein EGR_05421 [Echinococcus granulosus]EUB59659.1 hypothetical protein EGR_05421 [Echinococcus granulosus]
MHVCVSSLMLSMEATFDNYANMTFEMHFRGDYIEAVALTYQDKERCSSCFNLFPKSTKKVSLKYSKSKRKQDLTVTAHKFDFIKCLNYNLWESSGAFLDETMFSKLNSAHLDLSGQSGIVIKNCWKCGGVVNQIFKSSVESASKEEDHVNMNKLSVDYTEDEINQVVYFIEKLSFQKVVDAKNRASDRVEEPSLRAAHTIWEQN